MIDLKDLVSSKYVIGEIFEIELLWTKTKFDCCIFIGAKAGFDRNEIIYYFFDVKKQYSFGINYRRFNGIIKKI